MTLFSPPRRTLPFRFAGGLLALFVFATPVRAEAPIPVGCLIMNTEEAGPWLAALALESSKASLQRVWVRGTPDCPGEALVLRLTDDVAFWTAPGGDMMEVDLTEVAPEDRPRVVAMAFVSYELSSIAPIVPLISTEVPLSGIVARRVPQAWLRVSGAIVGHVKSGPGVGGGGLEVGAELGSTPLSFSVAVSAHSWLSEVQRGIQADCDSSYREMLGDCLRTEGDDGSCIRLAEAAFDECENSMLETGLDADGTIRPSGMEWLAMLRFPLRRDAWMIRPACGAGVRTGVRSAVLAAEADIGFQIDERWRVAFGARSRWHATRLGAEEEFAYIEPALQVGVQLGLEIAL